MQTLVNAVCSEKYDRLTLWDVEIYGKASIAIPPSEKNNHVFTT